MAKPKICDPRHANDNGPQTPGHSLPVGNGLVQGIGSPALAGLLLRNLNEATTIPKPCYFLNIHIMVT